MNRTTIVCEDNVSLHDFAAETIVALEAGGVVELDLSSLSAPDLWTVQVIEAARRQGATRDVEIGLRVPATGRLYDTLDRGGFLTAMSAADRNFWFKGESVQ